MSKIAHFRARIKHERKLIPEWTAERCRAEAADCRHPQISDAAVGRHNVCDLFAPDRSQPSPLSDVRPGSRPWAPPLPVDFADRQYEGRTDGEW